MMKKLNIFFKMFALTILFTSPAYAHPKGLYVLEYPVEIPQINIIDENGNDFDVSKSQAPLTIMTFWSKTCFPCLKEMKQIENFSKKANKDNIKTILISPSDEWSSPLARKAFLTKYGAPTIPSYSDTDNQLSLKFGIGSTPYTVIMDKFGKKRATIQGTVNWGSSKFYQQIKNLIN